MGLIRKMVTSEVLAVNRGNSRKSTGPRSELGKRHASRNSSKHLIFGRVSPSIMKELGEDPSDFERLREALRQDLQPQGSLEEMLVHELAENRWRRQRLLRAEASISACERRRLEIDRNWRAYSRGGASAALAERHLFSEFGFSGLPDGVEKFNRMTKGLRDLKVAVNVDGFQEGNLLFLDLVYGKNPNLKGAELRVDFRQAQKSSESAETATQARLRSSFVGSVEAEIESLERLKDLYRAKEVDVTDPMKNAQMLPSPGDLDRLMEYEVHLDRQFHQKLQQLVAWRRAKGQLALPKGVGFEEERSEER